MQNVYSAYGNIGAAGNQTVQAYGAQAGADGFTTALDLSFTPGAPPVGPAAPTVNLPDIILTPNFFNAPAQIGVDQMLVLVHELLHYTSQMGDQQLVNAFGIQQGANETASHALSAWLASGCGGH